jgi:hypothetical protein
MRGGAAQPRTYGPGLHKQLPDDFLVGLWVNVAHVAGGVLVAVGRVDAYQVRAQARCDAAAGDRHTGGTLLLNNRRLCYGQREPLHSQRRAGGWLSASVATLSCYRDVVIEQVGRVFAAVGET